MAGGTAAGCAAVWCCVPCGVLDFLVLTAVRVPAGLCKKAIRKRKRLCCLKNQKNQIGNDVWVNDNYGSLMLVKSISDASLWPEMSMSDEFIRDMDKEMMAMDEEMWEKFGDSGFWRSSSRKEQ